MKYVRKITPAPLSDAEGLESWLEDLALQRALSENLPSPVLHLHPRPGEKNPLPPGAMPPPPG